MVSGLLPALQFYEFYLIKSIKMGNRFKDLGKLSFSLLQYLEESNILELVDFFSITSQQDRELFKDREAAVLNLCPHSWQEAWPVTHQSVENKDTHEQMSVDLQSQKNVLGRHRMLSGDNSVSEIVCFVAPECPSKTRPSTSPPAPTSSGQSPTYIHICEHVHICIYACICMYMHVEAREQTQMPFHRYYLSYFFLAFICNGLVGRHMQATVHVWSSGDNLQCSLLFSCHVGHRDGAQVMRLESKHLYSLVNLPGSCSAAFWTRTLTDLRPVKQGNHAGQ